ncbi:MAG: His-Xaa-Ser system protein HxsD [Gammaproteobacteria bacterium]|nr:MAG: His-Xaa-Ser system protein HxsD [Gammaproteobacteria bacterium]
MLTLRLPQDYYSEVVVRKSLYWCDPDALWTLKAEEDQWVISVKQPAPTFEAVLHKHLNDFLLREKLDAKTRVLRDELISASLRAVMINVSKA